MKIDINSFYSGKRLQICFALSFPYFLFLFILPLIISIYFLNLGIFVFALSNLLAIIIYFIFILSLPNFIRFDFSFLDKKRKTRLFYILFSGTFIFIYFIYINDYFNNPLYFIIKYKNGGFSGSGFYTLISLYLSSFLLLPVIFSHSIRIYISFLFFILATFPSLVIGTRGFLSVAAIALVIKIGFKFGIILILLLLLAVFYFLALYSSWRDSLDFINAFALTIDRYNLIATLTPSLDNFSGFLVYLFKGMSIKSAYFEAYSSILPNLRFPVGLIDGVALPGSVFFYNIFGFWSFIFISFFMCINLLILMFIVKFNLITIKYIGYSFFFISYVSMIEDFFITYISFLSILPFILLLFFLIFRFDRSV